MMKDYSQAHQAAQVLHTENADMYGCPQADFMGERESSEFKRNLNGGPQADEVRIQVSINDD